MTPEGYYVGPDGWLFLVVRNDAEDTEQDYGWLEPVGRQASVYEMCKIEHLEPIEISRPPEEEQEQSP